MKAPIVLENQEKLLSEGAMIVQRSMKRINKPYVYSVLEGRNSYTYHNTETAILSDLRSWASKYFQDVYVFEPRLTLPKRKMDKEGNPYYNCFDIHGKIVSCQVLEIEQEVEIKMD